MTQEQLAEAMGVTAGAVYKWESQQSNPDLNLIIELADLFEVSTDVLLGYEWRNGSMGAALDRIIVYRQKAQYDEGIIESEKALKKYPNCFDIVYQSAVIYSEKGYKQKDQKAFFRALELFDMACRLIEQNTDENISELSICRQMARLHLSLGHADTCVDMLKKYNACGINNAMIGMILADCHHQPEEAIVYLGKAFTQSLDDMDAIMMGYANVFFRNMITKPLLPASNGYAAHYDRGILLKRLLGLTSMIVFFLYFVQKHVVPWEIWDRLVII